MAAYGPETLFNSQILHAASVNVDNRVNQESDTEIRILLHTLLFRYSGLHNDGSRDSCFDYHNIPHPTIDAKNTIVTAIAFVSGEDELHWLSPH